MDVLLDFDTWLMLTLNGINNEYIDPMVKAFSNRGTWVVMYVAIAAVIWWRLGWKRALIVIVAAGIAVGLTDFICSGVIRPMVQRMRPANLDNEISPLVHIVGTYRSGKYGFPSSHAANTFALALFTALVLKSRGYTLFIFAWAVLQCYSRIYLGVHYPGDLLVGAVLGSGISYGVYSLCARYVNLTVDRNPKAMTAPVMITGAAILLYIFIKNIL